MKTDICRNLEVVRARIAEAAERAGRDPAAVRLVAVSKTHPAARVVEAWHCGQREFGENHPEEGAAKIPQVAAMLGGEAPRWHMIGRIQRRKARLIVAHFDLVHAVDRLVLAQRLSRLAAEAERTLPVLLECNVSGEATKAGFPLHGWEQDAARLQAFFAEVEAILALPGLRVEGLMTMAPIADDAEEVRWVFASLRRLREALRERFPALDWPHLSMGMSDDFPVAVEEGATLVRIGRAIFGPREL